MDSISDLLGCRDQWCQPGLEVPEPFHLVHVRHCGVWARQTANSSRIRHLNTLGKCLRYLPEIWRIREGQLQSVLRSQ